MQFRDAVGRLPAGLFAMTAAHGEERGGVLVRSVQPCADEPLLISVALRKGHSIEPLIRDSRCFAICEIVSGDKVALRRFDPENDTEPEERVDPFEGLGVVRLTTGAPVLRGSPLALDCEVVRHFDLEADCGLYVGLVVGARVG